MSRTPDSDYPNRIEPFMLPGPLPPQQQQSPVAQPLNHMSYSPRGQPVSEPRQDLSRLMAAPSSVSLGEPSAQPLMPYYQVPEEEHTPRSMGSSGMSFEGPPRPASVRGVHMESTQLSGFPMQQSQDQSRIQDHLTTQHQFKEASEHASPHEPSYPWLVN